MDIQIGSAIYASNDFSHYTPAHHSASITNLCLRLDSNQIVGLLKKNLQWPDSTWARTKRPIFEWPLHVSLPSVGDIDLP